MFWRRSRSNGPHKRPQAQGTPLEMHMDRVGDSNQQVAPQDAKVSVMRMSDAGHGNVQVGHAARDVVSQVINHHHITIIQAPGLAHAPLQADATGFRQDAPITGTTPASHEQSAVLRRLDQLRDRVPVLDFMEREFGTRMVIRLDSTQLFRLHRYLDVVMRDGRNVQQLRVVGRQDRRVEQANRFA